MPTPVTETSTFDATVDAPVSGDARTAASVRTPFGQLANRTKYLNDQLANGHLVGGSRLDSSNGTTVNLSAIKALIIAGKLYSAAAQALTVSILEGGGAFGFNAWHYLYGYVSGGALAFQISTTVPGADLIWKNGVTTHRYLGAFRTGSAGAILPFRAERGEYTWRPSAYGSNFTLAKNAGAATTFADLQLTAAVEGGLLLPPHARQARVRVRFKNGSGGLNAFYLRTKGDSGDQNYNLAADGVIFDTLDVEADANGYLEYKLTSGSSSTLDAWVNSWRE
jgi:hypothetical protein